VNPQRAQWVADIRPADGDNEEQSLRMQEDENTLGTKQSWTKEEAEVWGRRWFEEIMPEWNRGVQERQISRGEAKFIRKEGSFPKYIKDKILPLWESVKGCSVEAIQGLYEESIQMERAKRSHQIFKWTQLIHDVLNW
jgi:hypothetical protein